MRYARMHACTRTRTYAFTYTFVHVRAYAYKQWLSSGTQTSHARARAAQLQSTACAVRIPNDVDGCFLKRVRIRVHHSAYACITCSFFAIGNSSVKQHSNQPATIIVHVNRIMNSNYEPLDSAD